MLAAMDLLEEVIKEDIIDIVVVAESKKRSVEEVMADWSWQGCGD